MTQEDDEPLEDYLERFQFSLKKNPQNKLLEESLKLVILRGVHEDCMDALNIIRGGDISQMKFEKICKICRNYLGTFTKRPRDNRTSILGKSSTGVSKVELSNLLSNMKEDIINHLATQLDTLHIKKHEKAEAMLTKYFPSYRKIKSNCKCKRMARIQQEKFEKLAFQPIEGDDGKIYIAQRWPWQQRQGMPQDPLSFNSSFPIGNQKFSTWNSQPWQVNPNQWKNPQWINPQPNWNQQPNPWPQQNFLGSNYNPQWPNQHN